MEQLIATGNGWTDISPKEAGFDASALQRLDEHYRHLIDIGTIQAAGYLLARGGRVFAHRSMGRQTGQPDSGPLQPGAIRKVYSITKVFTAAAIHRLIDQGKLHLSQKVSSIVPEFDTGLHRDISIFHLLTHTSGLSADPGFYAEPYGLPWYEWWYRQAKESGLTDNWIKLLLSGPLQNEIGKEWIYCSAGYVILAEVVSRVSGKPYEQYVIDEIAAPLGMKHTFFEVPGHLHEQVCYVDEWERGELYNPQPFEGRPPRGGNGLYSTLEDLWRFGQMMLNGGVWGGTRVLSKRAVEIQTTNHLQGIPHNGWGDRKKDYPFGLGWSLYGKDLCSPGTFNHEGFGHCGLYIDPVEQLVFVFFVPSIKGYTDESVVTPRAIAWSGLL